MVVHNFLESANLYNNFEIWDITTFNDFVSGNKVITEIIEKEYKVTKDQINTDRNCIADSDMTIILKTLELISDKSFVVFTLYDENHQELIAMQEQKMMTFGIDIEDIHPDHIYIMIMDKKG